MCIGRGVATFRPMALPATEVYGKAGVMPSSSSDPDRASSMIVRAVWVWNLVIGLALVGAVAILLVQVTVTNDVEAATRTCGSAFDALADRSGWELWWARDLDETDDAVRAALIRTDLCPAAVNQRIMRRSALGALARRVGDDRTAFVRPADHARTKQTVHRTSSIRLGRATTWTGATLSIAGIVAIVVLVADADSTLFLYVDRGRRRSRRSHRPDADLALFVIGRALMLAGTHVKQRERVEGRVDA